MEVKPGWKTTEFWMHIVSIGAVGSLQSFLDASPQAGFPPWIAALIQLIGPLAIVYLSKTYLTARTDAKSVHTELAYATKTTTPGTSVSPPSTVEQSASIIANIPTSQADPK